MLLPPGLVLQRATDTFATITAAHDALVAERAAINHPLASLFAYYQVVIEPTSC